MTVSAGQSWTFQVSVILLLVACVGLFAFSLLKPAAHLQIPGEYQAVLLTNGQVYFGKLEGLGGLSPTLHDVYYVQGTVNATTKEVTNILVRRGKEWHAPDVMILNPNHIVLVEPVGKESRVSQLIADLKSKP